MSGYGYTSPSVRGIVTRCDSDNVCWAKLGGGRQAHNLKVGGSNPPPATRTKPGKINQLAPLRRGFLLAEATIKPCHR